MRRLWWIALVASVVAIAVGIALLVYVRDQHEAETRGWEMATTQASMPLRTMQLAGINVELSQYNNDTLETELDAIVALGFTWIRQPFYWYDIEPDQGDFNWQAYDNIVAAVALHPELQIIAVLDGTPAWARDPLAPEHPFAPPASATAYGEFAATFAARYADDIDYYQLWDEPNLRSHWGNTDPRPAIYTAMLKAAYPAIHNADDIATVITAALAPTVEQGPENYNDITYLNAIYEHGGRDYFDAAAAKPYGYNVGPYDRTVDNGTFNFSRVVLMREAMVAQGDSDKPIWGSNFGWNHLPADWQGPPSIWGQVSAEEQRTYTQDALKRAYDEWPWMAGLILQHWQPAVPDDHPLQGFAVAPNADAWSDRIAEYDALPPGLHEVDNRYTTFSDGWQLGPLGADALPIDETTPDAENIVNNVTFQFHGTDLAILTRRYDVITGYYILQIDGQNANALPQNGQGESHIVLKSPTEGETVDLIEVATGLKNTTHTATLLHRPRQGDDAWGFAGIAVAVRPETTNNDRLEWFAMFLVGIGALGTVISVWRSPWRDLKLPSQRAMQDAADTAFTLGLTLVFMVGSALTWGDAFSSFLRRDPPAILLTLATVGIAFISPVAILSVIALLLFALVVFNRPLMGLLATLFWSMFFASTIDTYVRLIAAVEVMLVISLVAIGGRTLFDVAKTQKENENKIVHTIQRILLAIRLHPLDIAVALLVTVAIVSITWADFQSEALHELRVMMLGPALFYVMLRTIRLSPRELSLIGDTVIVGGTIIALIGLYNFVSGDTVSTAEGSRRLVAVYGSPNAVALQLGRCMPFAAAYMVLPFSKWRRAFGFTTFGIMGIAYLLTQSLGGIVIALPITTVIFLMLWQGQRAWRWVVALGGIGLVALLPLSRFIPRLRNLQDLESGSTLFRLNVWRSSLEMIQDHPITGVGLDQFLYAYRGRYILPEGAADPDLSHPHNIVLEHWVRFGLLGVVLLIYIQYVFWRMVLQLRDQVKSNLMLVAGHLSVATAMAYVLAHGLIDASLAFINLSYMYVLFLGLLLTVQRLASTNPEVRYN